MKPIISVLIPTLNRPEFAKVAVDSVLLQDGGYDFEIILSNNGSNAKIFDIFNSDFYKDKIKYVETLDIIPMTEHWEWASRFASGKYLMVLPDRRLLKQGAFKKLIAAMEDNSQCDACCFCDEWLYNSGRLVSTKTIEVDAVFSTKEILKNFENGIFDRNIIPLGLNSIVKCDFIERYRAQGRMYFEPISPDFRSAFNFLFSAKCIYAIAEPIMITTGFNVSNGGAAYKGDNSYLKSLKDDGFFIFMPRCLEGNVWGSIYEDYLRSKNELLGQFKFEDIMSKPAMTNIMVEEMIKIVLSKFNSKSRKRFLEIRWVLKQCGWQITDDFLALKKAFRGFQQFIPESLKKIYRSIYSIFNQNGDIFLVAGFKKNNI